MNPEPGIIHQLDPCLYLLWAVPRGEEVPFEVSKEVVGPLQPACATSPYCPDERIPRITRHRRSGFVPDGEHAYQTTIEYERNPNFKGVTECPYDFRSKEECYRDINVKAISRALFTKGEAERVTNYLRALDYQVEWESIPRAQIDGGRILHAHGRIYNFHETRFEVGPEGVTLCMIRNPYEKAPEE